jgi:hypothetical protein
VEISLADFDPTIVAQCTITEQDLQQVALYVRLLQGEDAPTLADIAVGGYYGTSALLHEVVELRALLEREPELLQKTRFQVGQFFYANLDAHAQALAVEYQYLGDKIASVFGERMALGALVKANAQRRDFEILAEHDIPVPLFEPTEAETARAAILLSRLRDLGKEMP